jgi:hypothetical protein
VEQLRLDRLDLTLSRVALAKEGQRQASLDERVAAIERAAESRPQLRATVTDEQLIADLAAGYDVCIVGADKWHQLHDPAFYGGREQDRDAALARLPPLAVALRHGVPDPPPGSVVVLDVHPRFRDVSSTAVRAGRGDWRAEASEG